MASISIHLPIALRDLVDGTGSVIVEADSVPAALTALTHRHPQLAPMIFAGPQGLRRGVHIFVDDRQVVSGDSVEDPLEDGAEIRIVPSIAGG